MTTQSQATGFLAALFDFSFSNFITGRLIKILFILGLALGGIGTLMMIATGFTQGFGRGLLMLILAPLFFLLAAMYLRVVLELLIVIFRIAENVDRIANRPASPGI
jgi:hypothetical protein